MPEAYRSSTLLRIYLSAFLFFHLGPLLMVLDYSAGCRFITSYHLRAYGMEMSWKRRWVYLLGQQRTGKLRVGY